MSAVNSHYLLKMNQKANLYGSRLWGLGPPYNNALTSLVVNYQLVQTLLHPFTGWQAPPGRKAMGPGS
jgi:hypothetical protein